MAVYDEDDEREWQAHLARERQDGSWAQGYRDSAAGASSTDLKQREASPQEGAPGSDQEAYDREFKGIADNLGQTADEPDRPLYSGGGAAAGGKTGRRERLGQMKSFVKKNKWKFIFGGAGAVAPLLVTLLIQLGSLLFPNIAAHIDNDRMRSLHRKFFNSMDVIHSQKLAYASTSDRAYLDANEAYRDDGKGLLSKINKYRPDKVASQMLLDIDYVWEPRKLPGGITREKLVAVKIDGKTIPIPENSRGVVGRVTHPIQYMREVSQYKANLRKALGTGGRLKSMVSTRGKAVKLIRAKISGVRMYRWTKDQVDKAEREVNDPEKLALEEIKTSYKTATDDGKSKTQGAEGVKSDDIKETMEEAAAAEAQCIEDAECLKQMALKGDGVAPTVDQIVANAFKPSLLKTAMSTVGTTYEIAAVMCLLYDSSIGVSKGVIAANSAASIRTYHSLMAAADAQIYTQTHSKDKRTNMELTGAYAKQLGDAGDSVPEQKASSGVGDTSGSVSPQGSAAGFYGTDTLGNFLNAAASSSFEGVAGPFCGIMTNPWGGGVVTVGELLFSLLPGVGQAVKAGGTVASKATIKIITKQFAEMIKGALTKRELGKLGAGTGATELAAYLARVITLQRLGTGFNGAAVGPAYLNQADAGAVVLAQGIDRLQNASIPMSTPAYLGSKVVDKAFATETIENKSPVNRYFSLKDPDSLLSRAAMSAYYGMRLKSFSSGLQSITQLANPFHLLSSLPMLGTSKAYANSSDPITSEEYGVTPWGWSIDEEEAYTADPEYAPLYNEKKLKESGMETQIAEKFGKCFNTPIEDLLVDGSITRDDKGNLIPERSFCSSYNMGDSGPDNDGKLTFRNKEAEIAFRWRVNVRNNNAADEWLEIQSPSENAASGNGVTGTGLVNADGYSWPVADQTKRDYGSIYCEKYPCHHDGTGAADLMYGSAQQMGGKAVYAISNGKVVRARVYREIPGCYSIQFKSDKDGYYYWYGHLQKIDPKLLKATADEPIHVNAGVQMAEVASVALGPVCHGRSPDAQPAPHLHIDRGCVRNGVPQYGGSKSCRDPSFIPFMNDMWSKLPAK